MVKDFRLEGVKDSWWKITLHYPMGRWRLDSKTLSVVLCTWGQSFWRNENLFSVQPFKIYSQNLTARRAKDFEQISTVKRGENQLFIKLLISKTSHRAQEKWCSNGKQRDHWMGRRTTMGYPNSGELWLESKHFGQQFNHYPSYDLGKSLSNWLSSQQSKFVDCSSIISPNKT